MQWSTPVAGANFSFRCASLVQCTLVHDRDKRIKAWIELFDASQARSRELDGRDLFSTQQVGSFRDGEFGHSFFSASSVPLWLINSEQKTNHRDTENTKVAFLDSITSATLSSYKTPCFLVQ